MRPLLGLDFHHLVSSGTPLANSSVSNSYFGGIAFYLGFGTYRNVKIRGIAPSIEAIPNIEFWRYFATLVQEGAVFFVLKVRGLAANAPYAACANPCHRDGRSYDNL